MVRPVQEVAEAIEEQDVKALGATGDWSGNGGADCGEASTEDGEARACSLPVMRPGRRRRSRTSSMKGCEERCWRLGHSPADARSKVMKAAQGEGEAASQVEDLIQEVYRQVREEKAGG